MLLIHDSQVDRAAYVIDTSQLTERLQEIMQLAPQGRPGQLPLRTYLVGGFLAIEEQASFKNKTIYEVLTQGMSIAKQWEYAVRFKEPNGETKVISKHSLNYFSRHAPARLAYTPAGAHRWKVDIDQTEMDRRRILFEEAMFALLDASIVADAHDGSWYAIDGSSTWSWGKSKYTVKDDKDVRAQQEVFDEPTGPTPPEPTAAAPGTPGTDEPDAATSEPPSGCDDRSPDEPDENTTGEPLPVVGEGNPPKKGGKPGKRRGRHRDNFDPDAAYGSKTSKGGNRESYYGYVIDAATRIPAPGGPKQPLVVSRLLLSPASTDVVAPTLKLLDSLADTPAGVTDIVVDRHYSYKQVERWADELNARGISQHFDLNKGNEQGFKDVNGMRLAGGWMHCPRTPDRLGALPRPGPGASKEQVASFDKLIAERQSWAMDRHESINAQGRTRWTCPAVAGKRGCPLRPETMSPAEKEGLPIVQDPPEKATAPKCCTNRSGTTSDRSDEMRKHQQPHYWGSPEWRIAYDLRTYVEGLFGSLKSSDTEGVKRGMTRFVGLPMVSLATTLAAAVCNVRHQRKFWEDERDRPDHPLLAPDPQFHGWVALTEEAAAVEDARHGSPSADAA